LIYCKGWMPARHLILNDASHEHVRSAFFMIGAAEKKYRERRGETPSLKEMIDKSGRLVHFSSITKSYTLKYFFRPRYKNSLSPNSFYFFSNSDEVPNREDYHGTAFPHDLPMGIV